MQACTEMVLRCETNNVTDMFPPKKYDVDEYCKEKWGVSQRAGWMNTFYWGKSNVLCSFFLSMLHH